jgi:hypothetical protein
MKRMRRSLAATSATLLAVTSLAVLTAPAASAAVSCSGTITYDRTYYNSNGNPIAELTIYYNSTNGGTNSACFYHRGPYYGVSRPTSVQIHRCAQRSPGSGCDFTASSRTDSGNYAYHAGPVGVTGTASYCVFAEGSMSLSSTTTLYVGSGPQGC